MTGWPLLWLFVKDSMGFAAPQAWAGSLEPHAGVASFRFKKKRREALYLVCFH
jgi:hypothetical protein